jgi:cytochrome c
MSLSRILAFSLVIGALPAAAWAQEGDATAGMEVFKKCMPCHNADNDKAKVGPSLHGVIGRQPGTVAGYKYSNAMVEFGQGKVWDDALLKAYLPNPRGLVKGTKMSFPGLKNDADIVNVIAYLKQVSAAK